MPIDAKSLTDVDAKAAAMAPVAQVKQVTITPEPVTSAMFLFTYSKDEQGGNVVHCNIAAGGKPVGLLNVADVLPGVDVDAILSKLYLTALGQ